MTKPVSFSLRSLIISIQKKLKILKGGYHNAISMDFQAGMILNLTHTIRRNK